MSKIFISHSSGNNGAALALAQWLTESGWTEYFLDISPSRGLSPGERWQEALKAAADRCEAVLFLISPAWRDSRWCQAEFLLAKTLGKTIFGVLVEDTPLNTLRVEMTAEWQLCDLVTGAARHSFRVSHDPIVPETEISFAEDGLARLKLGLQKAGLDPASFPWPPKNDPDRAPYRGLKALEPQDAAVFFGREASIVRGLDALRGLRERGVERLFVILGASGAGKSSFLRAGLWPRLLRDDRHFVPLPVIRPERAAISGVAGLAASLEAAFRERKVAKSRAAINQTLQAPGGFDSLLLELQTLACSRLEGEAPAPMLVISVDQGEELFSAEGRTEAEHFLDLLARTLASPNGDGPEALAIRQRPFVVVAIRSDSYERLQTEPRLLHVAQHPFSLPPIPPAEFKPVIEGPATRASEAGHKLTVDPALTEVLVHDAEGADALPLLAFTLERLYVEYGGSGRLRRQDYEALGGVRGSIEAAVEAAFIEPGRDPAIPADQGAREPLLHAGFIPWLARIDPDTEERKRRIARWEEIPAEARPLLERLIEQRLLVRDRRLLAGGRQGIVVEVAHEALLRQWPSLSTWLNEDAAALKVLGAVQRSADEWVKKSEENGGGEAWLVHTGERLVDAEALRRRPDFERLLGANGQVYVDACRTRDERVRQEKEGQLKQIAEERDRAERERERAELEAERARTAAEAAEQARQQAEAARQKSTQRFRWAVGAAVLALVIAIGAGWFWKQSSDRQHEIALSSGTFVAADAAATDPTVAILGLAAILGEKRAPAAAWNAAFGLLNAQLYHARFPHGSTVNHAAFSPDGKQVVTASEDKTARLWDLKGGLLGELKGHGDAVVHAAFSPDGKQVVTASSDKTARLWDLKGGLLGELKGHGGAVFHAAFSPDGKQVVTASEDKTARLWDLKGGLLAELKGHGGAVVHAAFSPDGKQVVTASSDNTARLWDLKGGLLVELKGHGDRVNHAAFSPDGKQVVTASSDNTARLWDLKGGLLVELKGHGDAVVHAAFSPDGKQVVTASSDNTARLWDLKGGLLGELKGHGDRVVYAAFSPDGKQVVTASEDNTARLWDLKGGLLVELKGHGDAVVHAAFSPDGKQVVTASSDNTARLWDLKGGLLGELKGHGDRVNHAAFSPDGKQVVTASYDKTARLWDLKGGLLGELKGHGDAVVHAAFSPDGKQVVTASYDNTARLWDLKGGLLGELKGHGDRVNHAAFSPDGKQVVTASEDKTTRLWDLKGGLLAELKGHGGAVFHAAFSPDGKQVVTASYDKTARLWDLKGGLLGEFKGHGGAVFHAAFSPDGKQVVTASEDNTSRLWDLKGGLLAELKGHGGAVNHAAFSPDGKQVVTASVDKTARLWDLKGGLLGELKGHGGAVFHAAFSPDGKQVVTASVDKTARLWDLKGGLLGELKGHGDAVVHAAFSPDGKQVVTASYDKTARLWPAGSAAFQEWVLQVAMPCLFREERRRLLLEDKAAAHQRANACARKHGLPEEAAPN